MYVNAHFVRAYMDILYRYVICAYLCVFVRIYVFARVQGICSYVNVSPFVDTVHMFIYKCKHYNMNAHTHTVNHNDKQTNKQQKSA